MRVKDKSDIKAFLTKNKEVIRSFKVNKVGLFGSFVRNEQKNESDIDLIVEYEKGHKTIDNFLGLIDFLEKNFERSVELVTPEALSKYIRPHIEKEIEYVEIFN